MNLIVPDYKWLFDGVVGTALIGLLGWLINTIKPHVAGSLTWLQQVFPMRLRKMGIVSFSYLPASPLSHGWTMAEDKKPSLTARVPVDRADGLAIEAEDAIDFTVDNHQRVCNRVKFLAKLNKSSYVYVKIRVVSKDGQFFSPFEWIACDIGEKPPRRESRREWVIHRKPKANGWTKFDLSLPEEVRRTYGLGDDVGFGELLGFRLRGTLSVSPINLYLDESANDLEKFGSSTMPIKREPWSRGDKIATGALTIAILTLVTALVLPEARRFLGLESVQKGPNVSVSTAPSPIPGAPVELVVTKLAKDVHDLRIQNHVVRLADSESDKSFAEIPPDSYGFVSGAALVTSATKDVAIASKGFNYNFEIQKLDDGSALIVGYVGPETFEHLREGLPPGSKLTLYSYTWKDAPNIAAVPSGRLKYSRARIVVVGDEPHSQFEVVALDSEVR